MTDRPTDTPPPAPLDPSAETIAEIERLHEVSRTSGVLDDQVALWRAVAALDRWVFINRGGADSPRPYSLGAEPGPMLAVYTSGRRAQEAAWASGLVPQSERVELLAVPLPAALDWALAFGQSGVVGVALDYPLLSSWCPLPNLARFRDERSSGSQGAN
ncbi:hypothetical protein ACSDQ9_10180 [Aestuariimicrobium soli]|uniref:hypothetical protein n=1 Tax=Aestuariimicrobium soli TaxID=2035834 RepID=UPI003EBABF0F